MRCSFYTSLEFTDSASPHKKKKKKKKSRDSMELKDEADECYQNDEGDTSPEDQGVEQEEENEHNELVIEKSKRKRQKVTFMLSFCDRWYKLGKLCH